MNHLIYGIQVLLNESITYKEIKITTQCDKAFKLIADKNMIETVIRNLLTNAVKYTPKGGKIDIRVTKFDNYYQVSIQDNGIGINPEIKEILFDITENKSTPGTENESGSGLGLILCKEFVDKHNGEIWVESVEGKGSTFSFTIPQN